MALTAALFAGELPLASPLAHQGRYVIHRCPTNFDKFEGFVRRAVAAQRAVDEQLAAHSAGAFARKRKP